MSLGLLVAERVSVLRKLGLRTEAAVDEEGNVAHAEGLEGGDGCAD